jgi:uncharacterized membrane protein YfcA
MTALAVIAVGAGALIQAVTGFGFSLVSAPFLLAAYGAPEGVRLNLLLSVGVNAFLLLATGEGRQADRRAALLLLGPAVAVTLPAAYLVHHAPPGPLTVGAGLVSLGGVLAVATGWRVPGLSGARGIATAGGLSGAMNVVAGMSGPPVVLFAVSAGWRPSRARSTLQLYFLPLNLAALATLGFPGHVPLVVACSVPAGAGIGALVGRRPPDRAVRSVTLAVAALGSVLAVARGLTG